jgi:hypothetical protein
VANSQAREMAPWVKCMQYKHKERSVRPGTVMCAQNPSAGGRLAVGVDPRGLRPGSLAKVGTLSPQK